MNIRNAGIEDAEAICALAKELERLMISLGTPSELKFNADTYRSDAFGKEPHFQGLVVESVGDITGYLLYHFGYDFDRAKSKGIQSKGKIKKGGLKSYLRKRAL